MIGGGVESPDGGMLHRESEQSGKEALGTGTLVVHFPKGF